MTNPCVRVLDGDKYLLIIPKGSIFVIKKIEAHTNKKRMFLTIEITNPQYKSISDFKTIPKINIGTWSYNWPDTLKGLKLTQITD